MNLITPIKKTATWFTLLFIILIHQGCNAPKEEEKWISLFNGKDLTDWKASENTSTFRVEDGVIVAQGDRSHLFYTGDVEKGNFKNFELRLEVMTHYLANSGVYIHTQFQDEGWVEKGYEIQINNSHLGGGDYREFKKTGSIYSIRNIYKAMAQDSAWFTLTIKVVGKHIRVTVNDIVTADYEEPTNPIRFGAPGQHFLGMGTIALQGHDPASRVLFKNIKIKILPDPGSNESPEIPLDPSYQKIMKLQSEQYTFTDLDREINDSINVDSTINSIYRTGINLGLVTDLSKYPVNSSEVTLINNLTLFADYPVFMGIKIHTPEQLQSINPDFTSQFDYVIGELNLPEDTQPSSFIEKYITQSLALLESGITIWGDATLLPKALTNQSKSIWTKERMLRVIQKAKENHVAIEINNHLRIPSLEFIALAKENGCKFTCGNVGSEEGVADINYFIEAIEKCKLGYKDIFIPDALVINQ